MLTGDKFETAENIGYACKLLDEEFHVFKLETDE
jgi:magnesium-transporting ATPase (P-type)